MALNLERIWLSKVSTRLQIRLQDEWYLKEFLFQILFKPYYKVVISRERLIMHASKEIEINRDSRNPRFT